MPIGIFNTSSNFIPQDLAKKSFASAITRLMPMGEAPLFGMTSMLPTETAVQVEHGFFTKTMLFPELTSVGSQAATLTTLDVTSTTNILPNMLMRVDGTYENIIINSIISPTQIQVTRGVGTVAAGVGIAAVTVRGCDAAGSADETDQYDGPDTKAAAGKTGRVSDIAGAAVAEDVAAVGTGAEHACHCDHGPAD